MTVTRKSLDVGWKNLLAETLQLDRKFSDSDIKKLSSITELDIAGHQITSLEPLRLLPQLEVLYISETSVCDLSPLEGLINLRELHATFCCCEDLGLLANLHQLEVLDISYPKDPHADISFLAFLPNLKELYCNGFKFSSIKEIAQLSELEILSLHFTNINGEDLKHIRTILPECHVLF
ncbi:MAG: hypothetical protein AAGI38_19605 [Bacteroidota bacterium]